MSKRSYSDDEKATALTYLEVNKGDVSRTARQTGVPRTTLTDWTNDKGTHPAVTEIRQVKKVELTSLYEEELRAAFAALNVKREEASYKDIGTVIGILTDKMLILRGEANNITQNTMTEEEKNQRLAEIFAQVAARREAAMSRQGLPVEDQCDPPRKAAPLC